MKAGRQRGVPLGEPRAAGGDQLGAGADLLRQKSEALEDRPAADAVGVFDQRGGVAIVAPQVLPEAICDEPDAAADSRRGHHVDDGPMDVGHCNPSLRPPEKGLGPEDPVAPHAHGVKRNPYDSSVRTGRGRTV